MSKPENGVSCRYQEALNGTWYLTVYGVVGSPPLGGNWSGDTLGTRPAWLLPILDVAAAADAFIKPVDPPPYRVLWFRINRDYQLLGFGRD